MLTSILIIIISLALLVWSADRFLSGASNLAKSAKISPMIIGMTIVALGTSGPEIVVALIASFEGVPAIGVGNAIGSNIVNIGLVLGITAIVSPLPFPKSVLGLELPVLIVITGLAVFFSYRSSIDKNG